MHSPRVLVRAGAWPACCRRDYFPRTEQDLKKACRACMQIHGRPPSVVGAGWSYYLWRRGARGPRLFMHNFKGKVDRGGGLLLSDEERWRSGTTIETVLVHYEKMGLTFATHPTMSYISLGAWFAAGNHGNGGEDANGSSKTMKTARVLNMRTGQIVEWNYKQLRRVFDSQQGTYHCVVDVSFQNMIKNIEVQKSAVVVDSIESANEWLNSKTKSRSYLRVLFQGRARDYSFGLKWQEPYDDNKHVDPHCCSIYGQWLQTDLANIWLGWREPLAAFSGKSSYRDANRWIPLLFPFMESYAVLRGFINFEVIFKPGTPARSHTPSVVRSLFWCHSIRGFVREYALSRLPTQRCIFAQTHMQSAKLTSSDRRTKRDQVRKSKCRAVCVFGLCVYKQLLPDLSNAEQ